jgi:spermidine synthase
VPSPVPTARLLPWLFVASGFAALVYQSMWTQYLGLVLGHAAYAQSLVLAIFMGGMAFGAWYASRLRGGLRKLLLAYALVEIGIGIAALAFHPLFELQLLISQQQVLPRLSGSAAAVWQWTSSAALIVLPCALLGATFPLLAAASLRVRASHHDARTLGGLYFANSIGAVAGVLAATFWLLPWLGMAGALVTAAVVNLLVGAAALWLWRCPPAPAAVTSATPRAAPPALAIGSARGLLRLLMLATALSSAFSFVYEIAWIRLLNQALGTTLHSFELMLAAFISGLALGGLWVRNHASRITDALRAAAQAQVLMGIAALLSTLVLTQSYAWVGALLQLVARNDAGYSVFLIGSAAIALLVMFPAAFLAGMTLPLFTTALLREGVGERAIGLVYAANTLGAIFGVLLALHLLIPLLGVQRALLLAALGDAGLGLYLLLRCERVSERRLLGFSLAVVMVFALGAMLGRPDPAAQTSGVYRTGVARQDSGEVLFLRDGKTSTVAITGRDGHLSILSNGKPDAALAPWTAPPSADESTMLMLGLLPLALHPAPEEIAVIGWGSGLTAHTLLGDPRPQRVDSIEIEPQMVEAARLFGQRVERAYTDPRSQIHIEDARGWLARSGRRFDVIVSEPSNPWVSGVAGLFTHEFYRQMARRLKPEGLLVQWLQTYELDDPLLAQMLAALLQEFPHAQAWFANEADLIVVASQQPLPDPSATPWQTRQLRAELLRVGLEDPSALAFRHLGNQQVLNAYVRQYGARAHSDYRPDVALQAPRQRFLGAGADGLHDLLLGGLPVIDILQCRQPPAMQGSGSGALHRQRELAHLLVEGLRAGRASRELVELSAGHAESLETLLSTSRNPDSARIELWSYSLAVVVQATLGFLPERDLHGALVDPRWIKLDQTAIDDAPPEASDASVHGVHWQVLQMLAAAARRDPAAMHDGALPLLQGIGSDEVTTMLSPLLLEQALLIAMLGALGDHAPEEAARLSQAFSSRFSSHGQMADIRRFLLAHAGTPACQPGLSSTTTAVSP